SGVVPNFFKSSFGIWLCIVRRTQRNEFIIWSQQASQTCFFAVYLVEPLVVITSHYFLFVKPPIDDRDVVLEAFTPQRQAEIHPESGDVVWHAVGKKPLGRQIVNDEKVVVEI